MPQLILVTFLLFAAWLIKRDTAQRQGISAAIWIPTIWVGILSSRPLSIWLGSGGSMDTLDGSPVDRSFYLFMIIAALLVLSRRGVNWGALISSNWPIFFFYGFLFLSVFWANSPISSFKRWTKEIGNIIVAMVILTEVNPLVAFRAVFVRCAYVLIPLSIILIRYFPEIGRRYGQHGGMLEAVGVTTQKNNLGTMVLVCGLIFFWDWLELSRTAVPGARTERNLRLGIAAIAVWLIYLCDSKTSILSLATGVLIVASVRLPLLRRRISALGTYFLTAVVGFFALDWMFGITAKVLASLGRDATFTGRTDVWRELLNVHTDPLLGTGFMSFWDDLHYRSILPDWIAFSAHNGYLEIYLAGGMVGVFALAVMILGTGARIKRALRRGGDYAAVRFAVFVAMLIANFAESNFACMTSLGFLFLLSAIGHVGPESIADATGEWTQLAPQDPAAENKSEDSTVSPLRA